MMVSKKQAFGVQRVVLLCVLFVLGGCGQQSWFGSTSAPLEYQEMAPLANIVGNFEDIELPAELQWHAEKSMAIRTESFKGGILVYSGRVELTSLKDFLIRSMENKKWKLAGEVQYQDVLLAFTKPNKTCMVLLDEGVGGKYGSTNVTMYVTVDVAAAGQLNPFGEPLGQ